MTKSSILMIAAALCLSLPSIRGAWAQDTERSDYIFRFSVGHSQMLLESMTFPESEEVDLDECTAELKINGPIGCAINCDDVPVCLYGYTGPSGETVEDILEKVAEAPASGAGAGTLPDTPDDAGRYLKR